MSSGKGLESLIPKKSVVSQPLSSAEKISEPQSSDSLARSSPPNSLYGGGSGSASRLAHEGFSGSPTFSPQKGLERGGARPKPTVSESIFHIEVEKIKSNPYQPRREFDDNELRELAQSIREFGIIQPLVVSKIVKETAVGTEVEYQLIAGERRLRAAKITGLERVPAIIKKIDGERHKLEIALIENIQRSDLNPLESAKAYARLQDEFNLTQREIAVRVGKSRESVANTMRLLNLPSRIQEGIAQNQINESQARALLTVTNPEEQLAMFYRIIDKKMVAKNLRQEVAEKIDPERSYWEKQLEEKLGTPVKVLKQGARGKMVIQFYSEEEWQALLNKLIGNPED